MRLRRATANDNEFAYRTKKAVFRKYVEQVWGWDEEEQRRLHERRFASQDFQVIQVSSIDVGILAIVREPDCIKLNQLFILPEYQCTSIQCETQRCVVISVNCCSVDGRRFFPS